MFCDFLGYSSLAGLPRLRLIGSSLVDVGQSTGFEGDELTPPDCIFRGLPLAAFFLADGLEVLLTPFMFWDVSALAGHLVLNRFVTPVASFVELLAMS